MYISVPEIVLPFKLKSAGEIIFEYMQKFSKKVMHIQAETGEKETFGQVLTKSIRTAIELIKRGVTQQDIISICSCNKLNATIPFLAGLLLGVKVNTLDPSLSPEQHLNLITQIKPNFMFATKDVLKSVSRCIDILKIDCEIVALDDTTLNSIECNTKITNFSTFLEESDEEKSFEPTKIDDVKQTALILFSSGTTGSPKGICLSHYSLLMPRLILKYANTDSINSIHQHSIISCASLDWISGINYLIISIVTSCTRVLLNSTDPKAFWTYLEKYKPTDTVLVAQQLLDIVNNYPKEGLDTSFVQSIFISGTPISKNQLSYARKFFPKTIIAPLYGSTECGGACFRHFLTDVEIEKNFPLKLESCGRSIPGDVCKLVDIETEELISQPYQRGYLRIKTPCEMNGYLNIDSTDCWDEEGFLKTEDIMYFDEDLCFYFVDRVKDMFKYKSTYVFPTFIEEVLTEHPAVSSAAVVGIPHKVDGYQAMGFVKLKNEFLEGNDVNEKDILKFVDEKVNDDNKLRGGLKIMKELPRGLAGKVKKYELRNMILDGNV